MKILDVIIVSALPISELRGGIPLAVYYGFDIVHAYFVSVFGNFIPVPFLLLFLDYIREKILKKWRFSHNLYLRIEKNVLEKRTLIDKYGYIGLTLFVAIPLPVTGAWTGCLLASLLKMDVKKSIIHITLGILIAGLLVSMALTGFISILNLRI